MDILTHQGRSQIADPRLAERRFQVEPDFLFCPLHAFVVDSVVGEQVGEQLPHERPLRGGIRTRQVSLTDGLGKIALSVLFRSVNGLVLINTSGPAVVTREDPNKPQPRPLEMICPAISLHFRVAQKDFSHTGGNAFPVRQAF